MDVWSQKTQLQPWGSLTRVTALRSNGEDTRLLWTRLFGPDFSVSSPFSDGLGPDFDLL